jgi:hypothetical protein
MATLPPSANSYSDSYADCNGHGNPGVYSDTNCNRHRQSNCHRNRHRDSNRNRNSVGHTHRDAGF